MGVTHSVKPAFRGAVPGCGNARCTSIRKELSMKSVGLGKTNISLSSIVMGTWQAGKSMWTGIDDSEIQRAVQAAIDAGITTFDTAEEYGKGHSERMLGKAIDGRRDQVKVLSKVFANHLSYDQVIAACERSLKNLATDYLDLYQIHWPSGSFGSKPVPLEETLQALMDLKENGKIRAIGVSNFSLDQLKAASRIGPIESLQPPYSLFWRHVETGPAAWCQQHQVTLLAYSPMAQGLLTGKFGPDHRFEKGDHRSRNRLFHPTVFPEAQKALNALRPIADRKGISMAQLALAWVIAKPGTCAIAGVRNARQAIDNAEAGKVVLTPDELDQMDRISRPVVDSIDDDPVLWRW
jgi:aryl-alcohol dehydrogenase-like predicted oxidoreductase